jgi:hypothetical protein
MVTPGLSAAGSEVIANAPVVSDRVWLPAATRD